MPLNPRSVAMKKFTVVRVRGGYDQNEVDDFLDRIELDWADEEKRHAQCAKEKESLRRKVQALTEAPTQVLPVTKSAERVLELAEQEAAKLLEEARRDAEQIIADANAQKVSVIMTARTEALNAKDEILRPAEDERRRIETEAKALHDKMSQIISTKDEIEARLRKALEAVQP